MSPKSGQNSFCSELSLDIKEQMFGTVPRVDVWFLIEYNQAWGKKAFLSSTIPYVVKKRVSEHLNSIPNSRLQLIKRHKSNEQGLKFYIGVTEESKPKLFELNLKSYEDIVDLSIPEIISGNSYSRSEPIFLVCTHGTHDQCCGRFGVPVYMEATRQENSFLTWQCTHLGGHRFAANFLCLPHGIYYGRVRASNVSTIIKDYQNQSISLDMYRGRSCYTSDVQAAEYFLRINTGMRIIHYFRFVQMQNIDRENSIFEFKFISLADEKKHVLTLHRNLSALENYTSCQDDAKSTITQYKLIEYKML
jgi:hypothetical protein